MHAQDQETIIAQCTPQGAGALALIRLSGANAVAIADGMAKLGSQKKLISQATHTIHYGTIVAADGAHIDHVLFLLMHGPRTFTGQDTVEITSHNNPFVVEQIIARAIELGARMAQAGEFSKRAVLNNKLSLLQAEAIHDVVTANSQDALKRSLAQLEGSISNWCAQIEKQLTQALALSEASFEFIDEEDMAFGAQIRAIIDTVHARIETLHKHAGAQQHIREGVRIALIGSVNAGKSSLFNALIGRNRSIVTELPGTTRDTVEAGLYRNGLYWTLVDTAGLRETTDRIEKEGISRSRTAADSADLILLLVDQSRMITPDEQKEYGQLLKRHGNKVILVESKTDLPRQATPIAASVERIALSTTNETTIAALEQTVQNRVSALINRADCPFLLNKRHLQALTELDRKLTEAKAVLTEPIAYELLSHHITDALTTISNLTGKSISEAGMDAVFREFCVGK